MHAATDSKISVSPVMATHNQHSQTQEAGLQLSPCFLGLGMQPLQLGAEQAEREVVGTWPVRTTWHACFSDISQGRQQVSNQQFLMGPYPGKIGTGQPYLIASATL